MMETQKYLIHHLKRHSKTKIMDQLKKNKYLQLRMGGMLTHLKLNGLVQKKMMIMNIDNLIWKNIKNNPLVKKKIIIISLIMSPFYSKQFLQSKKDSLLNVMSI